ncbi:MAG: tripartite tricarboxylate transporter TctB family protein [Rhodomicrobium sp.]
MSFESKRDYYAGALIALIGAGAAYEGSKYGIGSLAQMGSGFFPVAIGIGMIVIGMAIAASGGEIPSAPEHSETLHKVTNGFDWRGWFAIIAAVCLFMALSEYAGLLPAIFACVFVSALGSKATTFKEAFILAACVTAFGIALFSLGLKIQIPILRSL